MIRPLLHAVFMYRIGIMTFDAAEFVLLLTVVVINRAFFVAVKINMHKYTINCVINILVQCSSPS